MSKLRKKWKAEDIRRIIAHLDEKTGMDGASLTIVIEKKIDNNVLGTYTEGAWKRFSFSAAYFNDDHFSDAAAIDVIRHEYCHYLVHQLKLPEIYEDPQSHGSAWKSVCRFLNTDDNGYYVAWHHASNITPEQFQALEEARDIEPVNILAEIQLWGTDVLSQGTIRYRNKQLLKKYGKNGMFKAGDRMFRQSRGYGTVLAVRPEANKQMLYVEYDSGEKMMEQNRHVRKVVNGKLVPTKAA